MIAPQLTPPPGKIIISLVSIGRLMNLGLLLLVIASLFKGSTVPPGDRIENVRAFTRDIEFDYVSWILDAMRIKLDQAALRSADYLSEASRRRVVMDYLDLVNRIQTLEAQMNAIYADPNIANPESASIDVRQELSQLYQQSKQLGPVAESILQDQISTTVACSRLALGGQPIPPILYRTSPLPLALIVSPRDEIRQDANISLVPGMTADQMESLEESVDRALDVSSLVVSVGGIGVFPTMIMQTTDLNWLSEVVAHEWVHNYLTLRPLGLNYSTSPELRTMNETVASIAGKELGRLMMAEFYPDLLPPPPEITATAPTPSAAPQPDIFDFRAEMHTTRITVDRLLAEGRVAEAERYMEARRVIFWENGYQVRKLNQAYFAFHGAYADEPVGAAGEDPVGAAVRALRAQASSLAEFLNRIAWMSTFEELQRAVAEIQ